jgi:hypothetical protein
MSSYTGGRFIPVFYDGYAADGTTVINMDVPMGGCVVSIESSRGSYSLGGQSIPRVTRPTTATFGTANKKYIVAEGSDLNKINTIDPLVTNRRIGGVLYVYNPAHPENHEILALVEASAAAGAAVGAKNDVFELDVITVGASTEPTVVVGTNRVAVGAGGAALSPISLKPQ